jgi:DNA polymerase-1
VCLEYEFETENSEGWVEPGKLKAKKKRPFSIPSLLLPVTDRTPKGRASGTAGAIKKLLARAEGGSIAQRHLQAWGCSSEDAGVATARLGDLLTISAIDTIIETFLKPLAASAASSPRSRVHCSLNLNTETGRLSARRPNLQNQPSLERDRFGIRKAFTATPGQCLIVADYGQLELRVLAHLTRCTSMIQAFAAGGDFHSRTAIGMYPEVRAAVASGEVLLEEGEGGGGSGGVALLKDRFKEQRRKAKILNFSIAYGKTAFGLAKDWGVSLSEAEGTVKAWYADRPEVLEWQCRTREGARRTGKVFTMLGRQRDLPGIHTRRTAGHAERAAINTPIQGSAADIVMCAMLKVWRDEVLAGLGFRMILQVHDEVVLEGPLENAPAAQARLVHLMERPFDAPLLVDLTVDAKTVLRWGDVK